MTAKAMTKKGHLAFHLARVGLQRRATDMTPRQVFVLAAIELFLSSIKGGALAHEGSLHCKGTCGRITILVSSYGAMSCQ